MAHVASIVGAAAGANPVTAVVGLEKDLVDKFIPDPQAKAAAQAHPLDLQAQMQEALIDQQNRSSQRPARTSRTTTTCSSCGRSSRSR